MTARCRAAWCVTRLPRRGRTRGESEQVPAGPAAYNRSARPADVKPRSLRALHGDRPVACRPGAGSSLLLCGHRAARAAARELFPDFEAPPRPTRSTAPGRTTRGGAGAATRTAHGDRATLRRIRRPVARRCTLASAAHYETEQAVFSSGESHPCRGQARSQRDWPWRPCSPGLPQEGCVCAAPGTLADGGGALPGHLPGLRLELLRQLLGPLPSVEIIAMTKRVRMRGPPSEYRHQRRAFVIWPGRKDALQASTQRVRGTRR